LKQVRGFDSTIICFEARRSSRGREGQRDYFFPPSSVSRLANPLEVEEAKETTSFHHHLFQASPILSRSRRPKRLLLSTIICFKPHRSSRDRGGQRDYFFPPSSVSRLTDLLEVEEAKETTSFHHHLFQGSPILSRSSRPKRLLLSTIICFEACQSSRGRGGQRDYFFPPSSVSRLADPLEVEEAKETTSFHHKKLLT